VTNPSLTRAILSSFVVSSHEKALNVQSSIYSVLITDSHYPSRRLRGDLIAVFKICKGFDDVKPTDFFIMSSTGLRGHEFKLYKPQAHLDI